MYSELLNKIDDLSPESKRKLDIYRDAISKRGELLNDVASANTPKIMLMSNSVHEDNDYAESGPKPIRNPKFEQFSAEHDRAQQEFVDVVRLIGRENLLSKMKLGKQQLFKIADKVIESAQSE